MPGQNYSITDLVRLKLRYSTQRQKIIAQNIANADTPHYRAQDIDNIDFRAVLQSEALTSAFRRTHPGHFEDPASNETFKVSTDLNAEESPNGNSVILDDQLLRMNDTVADHRFASRIYSKYRELNRLATSSPSGG